MSQFKFNNHLRRIMEIKKSPNANLENKKVLYLLTGIVVALSFIFIALEWTEHEVTKYDVEDVEEAFEEELDVIQTAEELPPPPPPPPAPEVIETLNVVEDTEETESVDLSSEDIETDTIVIAPPIEAPAEEEEDNTIFMVVEQAPEFPGGMQKLMRYLGENVKYPVIAQENGIQGRAICQFVVNRDGSIVDVVVVRSAGDASLDKEAIRLIKTMPKWTPGKQRGKAVRVKFTLPVNFRLQ